jgi:hypothetical protein
MLKPVEKRLSKLVLCGFVALTLQACTKIEKEEKPSLESAEDIVNLIHTGNEFEESMVNDEVASQATEPGKEYYVQTGTLRVRAEPNTSAEVLGELGKNDKVEVVRDGIEGAEDGFVEVKIIKSDKSDSIKSADHLYISKKYLDDSPMEDELPSERDQTSVARSSQYFMIQNIATETIRVYRRECSVSVCENKMVAQTEMVAGEDENGTRTILGSFTISKWFKFYEVPGVYPSWYAPGYPRPPGPGAGFLSWKRDKYMPGGRGDTRGAFGWYTAKIGPNGRAQHTHGTVGWGSDGDKYIRWPKGFWINLFTDPRSHGCSRTTNPTIAYLRELLPVGSKLIKIYAREGLLNSSGPVHVSHSSWNYILTTNGAKQDGQLSDRDRVLRAGTPRSQWLEEGTYTFQSTPSPKNGDVYDVRSKGMIGTYYVDAGVVSGYSHPGYMIRNGLIGGAPGALPSIIRR